VVAIQPFGAFVELFPGKDGLLHISRVAKGRVEKVEDVLNVGDEVEVEIIDMDDRGKVSLDRLNKPDAPAGSGAPRPPQGDRPSGDRPHGGGSRDPRRRH
jgi:polyribonucleotide nucleotidyltransferase